MHAHRAKRSTSRKQSLFSRLGHPPRVRGVVSHCHPGCQGGCVAEVGDEVVVDGAGGEADGDGGIETECGRGSE